ncbi:MAG: pyridine nucleotide-disulfide oxidoreductase [Deltaproteobacteria bacterium RIFCSPLOWO2_12_FULL_40_28]|nr:MAG: pyridine nucleotide-disulfide oxidoreductase [Deltaproteobacteria bacterium RIFCSPHIGHO2_02_FULL_40_28]OGQ19831.1 MAG: pyridine nucleotide-disulfide oxidoreductase [Deltaproteobacteria bacterium RIFCSPHIGHO2_12_FULL_40_32]OGQ39922.1 MAG: pyridine nucleotide-disulfide oxidoreductase [Deltaproteobacteria bacterium RIFCSPLOWO2_02_FULL_40_36]OGQ54223.1 MAG: pyridine nucleotide-disulfide oxidoreductase [Deltaproteobacteria bacterium RIFCSPLOWO2_12_FULL_40_28]
MQTKKYHLIVIGAGSGGLVAAAGAAGLGAKVALIEKHKMGGDCLNTGCVPSKAIIRSAKIIHDAQTAERFGLKPHRFDIKLDSILASVREVQTKLAHHDSVERFTSLGVDVHLGEYQFISPNQISNGKETLEAKRFCIATGAAPFVPPIPGLDKIPSLTSDNVWQLKELPKNLIVLGGGPIGAELAQTFARLGSKVTLVEMADRLLIREDPEVSELVKKRFEAEGLTVLLKTKAEQIDGGLIVSDPNGQKRKIAFDQILVAVGRAPNVNDLGLEKAGVQYDKKGIKVDATLQTTAKHIYACGDIVGPYQFTHTADFQARLILRNALFPGKSKIDYRVVPWCTFTEPEVARVGINESEAKQKNIPVDVFTYAMTDLDRAVCDREDEGFIKVLTSMGADQILGVTLVGLHAGDLLHELALAMHQKIGLKKVASMIHVYPTLAELSKRIADTYQRTRLTDGSKKWLKRYFQWRFG